MTGASGFDPPSGAVLADLLPPVYTEMARAYGGRIGRDANEQVIRALVEHLQHAQHVWMEGARSRDQGTGALRHAAFETHDRFSSVWASRDELLGRIQAGMRVRRDLADIALLMVEARLDLIMLGGGTAEIQGVGKISIGAEYEPEPLREWYRSLQTALMAADAEPARSWLSPRRSIRRSLFLRLATRLRFSAVVRTPVAYRFQPILDVPDAIETPVVLKPNPVKQVLKEQ